MDIPFQRSSLVPNNEIWIIDPFDSAVVHKITNIGAKTMYDEERAPGANVASRPGMAPPAPQSPALQHIHANLAESFERLNNLRNQLGNTLGRLYGDGPTGPEATKSSRACRYSDGGLGQLDGMSAQIANCLDDIEVLAARLEQVV